MIKRNKTTVTVSIDEWDDLLEQLYSTIENYQKEHLERCFMIHFIRYNNLEEAYEAFKASPPDDDPDDNPFDSYRG